MDIGGNGVFGMRGDAPTPSHVLILIEKNGHEQENAKIHAKVMHALELLVKMQHALHAAVSLYNSFE